MKYLLTCAISLLLYNCILVAANLCPNQQKLCPYWATCCKTVAGNYGCCPYAKAQCCSDQIHCCPKGSECNVKKNSCDSTSFSTPFNWMVPLYPQEVVNSVFMNKEKYGVDIAVKNNECPDGRSCSDDATCCQMPNGEYGCCPYVKASCCADKIHCCPKDYDCDIEHERCVKKESFAILSVDDSAVFPLYNLVKEQFEDFNMLISRNNVAPRYLCQPLNQCTMAGHICCSTEESEYCCPVGTTCGMETELCVEETKYEIDDNALHFIETLKKDVVCPDKTETCPSQFTCCLMTTGSYGCCSLPEATCCADKMHCCPNGYICAADRCERKQFNYPFDQSFFFREFHQFNKLVSNSKKFQN